MTVNNLETHPGGGYTHNIRRDALDKKAGMTLAEVASFVQTCMKSDAPGMTTVKPHMGWRGQIEGLSVTWGSEP